MGGIAFEIRARIEEGGGELNEEREGNQAGGTSVYTYLLVVVISDESQLNFDALAKLFISIHDGRAY